MFIDLSKEFYSINKKLLYEFQGNLESTLLNSNDSYYAFADFQKMFYEVFDNDRKVYREYFDMFRSAEHKLKMDRTAESFVLLSENFEFDNLDLENCLFTC